MIKDDAIECVELVKSKRLHQSSLIKVCDEILVYLHANDFYYQKLQQFIQSKMPAKLGGIEASEISTGLSFLKNTLRNKLQNLIH